MNENIETYRTLRPIFLARMGAGADQAQKLFAEAQELFKQDCYGNAIEKLMDATYAAGLANPNEH